MLQRVERLETLSGKIAGKLGANASLAAWLASRDALPGDDGRYRISQGREVGHDAIIELHVDADGDVWSGGRVQTVVDGMLHWERG